MYILAVDTALGQESVAILKDGKIVAFSKNTESGQQAEKLFERIDGVLDAAKLTLNKIDYFSANLGPGSFTGIRVGLSAILGICIAQEKKFIVVGSLEALAYRIWQKYELNKLSIALDAGRGEAYFQEFVIRDNAMISEDGALLIETEKLIMADAGNMAECKINTTPDARDVAYTAYYMVKRGKADFERKEPIYLRKPDAKIQTAV